MGELKSKAIKGVGWSAVDNVTKIGVQFIIGIILARILSPNEYGLIGILTIFISLFNFIVNGGFSNALIRKKEIVDADYQTVFVVNIVVSFVLTSILFFVAPLIADFFKRPELISLTRVMSSIVVINALAIVQRTRMTKKIDFKTQTKITFSASVISGIVGIVLAYHGCGVWALVAQQITLQTLTTLLLWVYNRWVPKFQFSKDSFNELWAFSWKLLCSGLLDTLWRDIYQVVIGKCYTPVTLGLYTRARNFCGLFSSNLNDVVQRVSFPLLSNIQDDKIRLKGTYKRMIKMTMYPTFIFMLGLAATSKMMVLFLLGPKWIGCVPFIQLVCFSSMLYPLHSLNLNMLQVQGRSDLFLKLEIYKKILSVGPIFLGIYYSIYLMLGCSIITGFFAYYLNAYYSGTFLNYSIREQLYDILPSFIIALSMSLIVFLLGFLPYSCYLLFPMQVIAGGVFVIFISEKLKISEYIELKNIILKKA